MEAVVDYVRREFVGGGRGEMRYHSPPNGWTGNPADSPAAPWVLGRRGLQEPWEALDEAARHGRRVYLQACISCHTPVEEDTPVWRNLAVSYPPGNYLEHGGGHEEPSPAEPTAVFELHEPVPAAPADDPLAQAGRALWEQACADCHAGNGSGRNWIGSFIDPPPPDLRDPSAASFHSVEELTALLRDGVPGTAMPAFGAVLGERELAGLVRYFDTAIRPLAD